MRLVPNGSGQNQVGELIFYEPLFTPDVGPFLKGPGNLPGLISVLGNKCFLTNVHFC